jgi:hypothetical protein
MILSNTLTSAAVQGTTVQAAADDNPVLGYGVVGQGRNWVSTPGLANAAISALGTLNLTGNIDWSAAGYFSFTCTASAALVLTFATTATATLAAASQINSFSLGQVIKIRITSASGTAGTIAWPSTVTWAGTLTAGGGTHAAPLPVTGSVLIDVTLVCTGVGSAPTFDGTYVTAA